MSCASARIFGPRPASECPSCGSELERIGREDFCSKDCGWLPVIIEFDNASQTRSAARPMGMNASVSSPSMLVTKQEGTSQCRNSLAVGEQ
jgi:predicted amidophosphoribosyltransferase